MDDSQSTTHTIDIRDLTRRFGDFTAVNAVNLTVARGEIFGLIGPNGAGKSTLIKMLTTLLPPTSGTALIAGHDIVDAPAAVRRNIGYVPQLLSADGSLTGYENMLLSARLYGVPRSERAERIERALSRAGLLESAHHLAGHYSGGMIRRLEIAQSMLHRPPLLFLDEPTVGLDPGARRAVWEHIEDLRSQFGTTILLTTHMMEEADALCERVAIMHHGKLVACDTPADLKAQVSPEATLDDVFIHFTGDELNSGGSYRETTRTRRTARRLG